MKNDRSTRDAALAPMRTWLAEPLSQNVATAIQRLRRAPDVVRLAIMPDVHLATHVCVGVVLATRSLIYPQAVGGDIGCGISAIALDAEADALADPDTRWNTLWALQDAVPILRHRRAADAGELPHTLVSCEMSCDAITKHARKDGVIEFGTLGRGNHFLEVQADESGRLWLTVHSGSRCIGQAIAAHHMQFCERASGGLVFLDSRTARGAAYLHDAGWAEEYAAANRAAMLDRAAVLLGKLLGMRADESTRFGTSHNHIRMESHFGEDLFIHRKGSSIAAKGVQVIIPGSMAGTTFHVVGRGEDDALHSSSHGAGRAMSRTEASRSISTREVHAQLADVTFDPRLVRHFAEESPTAYRDIRRVMRAQHDLVRIERTLRPLVCHKGA